MLPPTAGGSVPRTAARFLEDVLPGGHHSTGEVLHVDGRYHTLDY